MGCLGNGFQAIALICQLVKTLRKIHTTRHLSLKWLLLACFGLTLSIVYSSSLRIWPVFGHEAIELGVFAILVVMRIVVKHPAAK